MKHLRLTSKSFRATVLVKIPLGQRLRFLFGNKISVTIGGKIIDGRNQDISHLDLQLDGLVAVAEFNRKETFYGDPVKHCKGAD